MPDPPSGDSCSKMTVELVPQAAEIPAAVGKSEYGPRYNQPKTAAAQSCRPRRDRPIRISPSRSFNSRCNWERQVRSQCRRDAKKL